MNRFARFIFCFSIVTAPASAANYYAFGDSLTNTAGQAVTGYIAQLNAQRSVAFNNLAHGGDMVGDQLDKVYTVNPSAGDCSIVMLGVNDERFYGTDATKQGYYHDGLMAAIAWLALTSKQTARSVGGESGAWVDTGIEGIGRSTTQVGATKTFSVSGTAIYLAMMLADTAGANGTYSVSVDGGPALNFNSSAPGVTSYNGYAYTDRLHRFAKLAAGPHTIKVTMTGPSNLYVQWAGGNAQAAFPAVYVGNVIRQSNSPGIGYSEWGGSDANVLSYNADATNGNSAVVSALASDGLAVSLVDVYSAVNDTTDLSSVDGLHPVQSGQNNIDAAFLAAFPSFSFVAVPTYRRNDGLYFIDDAPNRRQLVTGP